MYKNYFKRIFDFLIALIMLIILLPLIIVTCILLVIKIGNPIFFKQQRLGQYGKTFSIIKFKTMRDKVNPSDTDSMRMTKIGAFLRKTSIDEIPQLINILKGDMSFIGPRPLLTEYLDYFTTREKLRFDLKPGMSGYAEIMGRHQLSWEQQFEYDVQYVEKISLITDIKIFLKTIPKVLNSSKVSGLGNAGKDRRLDVVRKKAV
jgi:undecaprenyl phosphate N,N'-diacetylbacillosamine 1-phosphate transferase